MNCSSIEQLMSRTYRKKISVELERHAAESRRHKLSVDGGGKVVEIGNHVEQVSRDPLKSACRHPRSGHRHIGDVVPSAASSFFFNQREFMVKETCPAPFGSRDEEIGR